MTKSIKEKTRLALIREIQANNIDELNESAIKVKIQYNFGHMLFPRHIIKSAKQFYLHMKYLVGPALRKNMPRLLVHISRELKIYDFDLFVRIHYDKKTNNIKNTFTVNFQLTTNGKNIGTLDFIPKEEQTSFYKYHSSLVRVSDKEIIDFSKKLYLINPDTVYVELLSETISKEQSNTKLIIQNSKFLAVHCSIKSIFEYFLTNEKLISYISELINRLCVHYYIGGITKYSILFYPDLSLSKNQLKISKNNFRYISNSINNNEVVKILLESNILPDGIEYDENRMTEELLYDIFEQVRLLNY